MKKWFFSFTIFTLIIISCAQQLPSPTAFPTQPQFTSTPILSSTPTITSTATVISSATLSPTETPLPIFIWSSNFENNVADFNGAGVDHWADGPDSYYEIIDDPTNSGKGKVYRGIVKGLPPESNHFGGNRHAPFPEIYFPYVEGAYATEGEIWISSPVPPVRISPPLDTDAWFSPVSLFDTSELGVKEDGYDIPPWHFAVSTHLGFDPGLNDGVHRLVLLTNEDDWLGSISPIPFPFEQWVKLRLEVGYDRIARLYQDGILVSEKRLPDNTRLGTVGGHWGLYAGRAVNDFIVLNDNLVIVVYPSPSQ